jgi:hypothetical protein
MEAERFGVEGRVIVHGQVARRIALEAVRGAALAVVITSVAESGTPEENGMVTGKIFEPIGLGTPTLLIAPRDSDARRVAEVTGVVRSFTASDLDGMVRFLADRLAGDSLARKACTEYRWDRLAREFDDLLSRAIQTRV